MQKKKIPPHQKQNAVVIIGRFQPPTKAHFMLIDKAKKHIRLHGEHQKLSVHPIVVIINGTKTSHDHQKNPLTISERKFIFKHSGKANGVKVLVAKDAFDAFIKVREAGFEPFVIGGGDDRIDGYLDILAENFLDEHGGKIKRKKLSGIKDRISASGKGSDIPMEGVSSTLARKAAKNEDFPSFLALTNMDEKMGKKFFKIIRSRMGEE